MKSAGFSLIELMVVIAIVALLSAVAIPSYKIYVAKAKLAQALTAFDSFVQQARQYYNLNGIFPTNAQLGVPAGLPASAEEYIVKPYLSFVSFAVTNNDPSGRCNFAIVSTYISNYGNGDFFTDSNATITDLRYYLVDMDGIIAVRCQAMEYENTVDTGNTPYESCDVTSFATDVQPLIDSCMP